MVGQLGVNIKIHAVSPRLTSLSFTFVLLATCCFVEAALDLIAASCIHFSIVRGEPRLARSQSLSYPLPIARQFSHRICPLPCVKYPLARIEGYGQCSLLAQQAKRHNIVQTESQFPQLIAMDALLRQSKGMCPFLKKTTPATLRALSTSTRPQASQCGGTISKLQLLGQRCPVMGKALAIQSARVGCKTPGSMVGASAVSGVRTLSGHAKAKIHTSRPKEARAVDPPMFAPRDSSMSYPT